MTISDGSHLLEETPRLLEDLSVAQVEVVADVGLDLRVRVVLREGMRDTIDYLAVVLGSIVFSSIIKNFNKSELVS